MLQRKGKLSRGLKQESLTFKPLIQYLSFFRPNLSLPVHKADYVPDCSGVQDSLTGDGANTSIGLTGKY